MRSSSRTDRTALRSVPAPSLLRQSILINLRKEPGFQHRFGLPGFKKRERIALTWAVRNLVVYFAGA
jgi:hypothetical protein